MTKQKLICNLILDYSEMPSNRQKLLSFAHKFGHFIHFKGRGLIRRDEIHERLKKMTLMGSGSVSYKHNPALEGGAIKYHNRPYQLKDSDKIEHKKHKSFAPIHCKI